MPALYGIGFFFYMAFCYGGFETLRDWIYEKMDDSFLSEMIVLMILLIGGFSVIMAYLMFGTFIGINWSGK